MRKLWPLLLIAGIDIALGSSHSESCVAGAEENGVGSSLLQAKTERSQMLADARSRMLADARETAAAARKMQVPAGSLSLAHHQTKTRQPAGAARATLPPHLFEVGLQMLQTEQMLDAVVANTVVQSQVYAGVSMTIRMVTGDAVDSVDAYGLASLAETVAATGGAGGMMSMLDIGGNYGRVSIAAFKNHPTNLRIIAVEPVPSTCFLLRWNLWLNGVPELELQEFYHDTAKPGVLPLNHGIEDKDEKATGFCYRPPMTMNSRMCDCSKALPGETCQAVISKSMNTLATMFGGQAITFVKVDCEGCEVDVIPSLINLQATTGLQVHRFAGELHAMPNEIEDWACQAEGAKWFVSICYQQGVIQTLPTKDRCLRGPTRESCSRIAYSVLRDQRPPPSEW